MFRRGVAAASPSQCLAHHWPAPPVGSIAVIAFGKAAVQMAALASRHYPVRASGLLVHPDGEGPSSTGIPGFDCRAASHPVPDERSMAAAVAALDIASGLDGKDLLLVLISGGGSSLLSLPAEGITLADKQRLTRALLGSGATIAEINCVRKHISRIKGGRLATATPAAVVTLAISDIPGDDPAMIASGPTLEDETTLQQAREILGRYRLRPSESIRQALLDSANETPAFGEDRDSDSVKIVASGRTALEAASELCRVENIEPIILGDHLEGEARTLAAEHARMALAHAASGRRCCILSGGETTVTLDADPGKGGRNTEYALALAMALDGHDRIWALSADTDGIDGSGGHSGALVDPATLARASRAGLKPREFLLGNDSATFFDRIDGLLREGASGTNVNDFRAIMINP